MPSMSMLYKSSYPARNMNLSVVRIASKFVDRLSCRMPKGSIVSVADRSNVKISSVDEGASLEEAQSLSCDVPNSKSS